MTDKEPFEKEWARLQGTILRCKKCKRLSSYVREVGIRRPPRYLNWSYWSKPLPGFGDPEARVLILGLAPSAHGGNRTGRMFTGDRSGEWLFEALHRFGFANQPYSDRRDDNLKIKGCYITATVRCAPPQNRPTDKEIEACRAYLLKEFHLLRHLQVIVPLGRVAFREAQRCLRILGFKFPSLEFGHGKVYSFSLGETGSRPPSFRQVTMVVTYHPSQQNTFTGKLSRAMFHQVFETVRAELDKGPDAFGSDSGDSIVSLPKGRSRTWPDRS
ncbi:MAG: uracil-DNA glycosylase [Desulfobacterota bacterium]|nr:uracil-DNA glycosylase [Thermodesulfobacteriota bacterium]